MPTPHIPTAVTRTVPLVRIPRVAVALATIALVAAAATHPLAAQDPAPPARGVAVAAAPELREELAGTRLWFGREDAIWTCDGNGGDLRQWSPPGLEFHSWLALSPTADRLAWVDEGLRLTTAGGPEKLVAAFPGWGRPVWSPRGDAVAVGTDEHEVGKGSLWLVDVRPDAGEPRRLVPEDGYGSAPAFSPDGRWVAFANSLSHEVVESFDTIHVERESRLEIVELDSGRRRVASSRTGEIHAVAWSPDGRHLAFEVDGILCAVPMAAGEPGPLRELAAGLRRGGTLVWDAASTTVLADRTVQPRRIGGESPHPGEDAVLLVPLDAGPVEIPLGTRIYHADFGPTADWIACTCADKGLYRLHVPTRTFARLNDGAAHWAQVWWRPIP